MKSLKLIPLALIGFGLFSSPIPATSKDVSANLQLARQLNAAFVEVSEKVQPSVVVITVVQRPGTSTVEDDDSGSFDLLPREWRDQFRRRQRDDPRFWQQGQGSGVIIRPDGYILTNGHVVEDAESIQVRLQDGRVFKARIRGVDTQSDVAVIKIDAKDLIAAKLADSTKTKVGEFAIAVGAPFSLDYTVTFGHVSAKGRSNILPVMESNAMSDQDFIQTDANINPGNSGGPLVNIEGEVIGINTLIRGLHTGIGFAVPSGLAKEVSDQLISDGKFTRAWLGIGIRALRDDPEYREQLKGIEDGVIVMRIMEDGPASNSDLKPRDIITAVEGRTVGTAQELRTEVRAKKIGEPITVDVFRPDSSGSGKMLKLQIKPAVWQDVETTLAGKGGRSDNSAEFSSSLIGVTIEESDPAVATQLTDGDKSSGVRVVAVEKGKPAARHGIKPGDVIVSCDRHPISTAQDFREALKKASLKKGVALNLIRGDSKRLEVLKADE